MTKYRIYENYRDDGFLREAFFDFIARVYPGLDFRTWYSRGFWLNNYMPHSIVIDDKIVSNVSTTKMQLYVEGELLNGIQIGTVGTIREYQRRGFSRILIDHVLERYLDSTDLIFLYSSEEAMSFYPRFGFDHYNEVIFRQAADIPQPLFSARKLNMSSDNDFKLVLEKLKNRTPISRLFGARDYDFITVWHILNLHPENLYYLEKEDILTIASMKSDILHIWDIIYKKPFEIAELLPKLIRSENLKSVNYYFSPDQLDFKFDDTIIDSESPLFVKGHFPIEAKMFKFPTTAQT